MCLIKNHRFPKISFKPIKVFKLALFYQKDRYYTKDGYYTYFRKCPIYLGKLLLSEKHWIKGIFAETITSEGVHAYITSEGVHAYLGKPNYTRNYSIIRLLEAEIPPFTPYWIDRGNEVAAAKLRIIREIDI